MRTDGHGELIGAFWDYANAPKNSAFCPHSVFTCFVSIWEQRAVISRYNINWLVLGAFANFQKLTISCVPSVRPSEWDNSASTGRIVMKFDTWVFLENLLSTSSFIKNLTRITDISHEDRYTFSTISRLILLRMRNVSDKSCRENQNTHFVFSKFFFLENRAVYEIMWKNIVVLGRPHMTIWRMRIAC
jgi:hypothetical protein